MKLKFNLDFNFSINGWSRKQKKGERSVCSLFSEEIERLSPMRGAKTLANYQTAMRSLMLFAGTEVALADMNNEFICSYEHWLKHQGISPNTISCYMRSLRTLWRSATSRLELEADNPFKNVFTGNAKTRKRSITIDDIRKLRQLVLPPDSFEALSRDVFLFSFYALGMPFVDVAHLCWSHIADNVIFYYRRKTCQPVKVHLEPCMIDIVNRYGCCSRDLIFPFISHPGESSEEQEYQLALNKYNRALKRIGRKAGIGCVLTSYVVRHTWASVAFSSNVELPVISRALGHTNTDTTLIYIREIDDNRLDEANRMLLENMGL